MVPNPAEIKEGDSRTGQWTWPCRNQTTFKETFPLWDGAEHSQVKEVEAKRNLFAEV